MSTISKLNIKIAFLKLKSLFSKINLLCYDKEIIPYEHNMEELYLCL